MPLGSRAKFIAASRTGNVICLAQLDDSFRHDTNEAVADLAVVVVGFRMPRSVGRTIVLPIAITIAMLVGATITAHLGGPSPVELLPEYVAAAAGCGASAILVFIFIRIAALARIRADRPLAVVFGELRPKLPYLILPVLVTPTFLSAFTAAKSAIPRLVGFRYDRLFANMDAAIFGTDPWRLTHLLIGSLGTKTIEFFYVAVWITALAYSQVFIPLYARRTLIARFFTAMLLTWFIAGFVLAYAIPAAGPVFVELADPTLDARFAPLKSHLAELLSPSAPFISGPKYLLAGIASGTAYSGGGISAMPSMHIAVVTVYVLAARGTKWFLPAVLFAAIILVGSVHSGYHYFVDSVVGAAVALLCWKLTELFYAAFDSRASVTVDTAGLAPTG